MKKKFVVVLSGMALGTFAHGQAAAYSVPPTWSPMTMLQVGFDPSTAKLSVVDPTIIPVLTIAEAGTYDPAQPWSVLDGTAFSRRLGWWDKNANMTDGTAVLDLIHAAYGSGAGIWIESVSQSAGLETYLAVGKYGVNSNNTTTVDPAANGYSGIFGTAGSSAVWQWNGKMDHNAYAVPLNYITTPNQLFTATYNVYVGDSMGLEILNPDGSSASTRETWIWQAPPAVPLPGALWLFGPALAGLLGLRRKIQNQGD